MNCLHSCREPLIHMQIRTHVHWRTHTHTHTQISDAFFTTTYMTDYQSVYWVTVMKLREKIPSSCKLLLSLSLSLKVIYSLYFYYLYFYRVIMFQWQTRGKREQVKTGERDGESKANKLMQRYWEERDDTSLRPT